MVGLLVREWSGSAQTGARFDTPFPWLQVPGLLRVREGGQPEASRLAPLILIVALARCRSSSSSGRASRVGAIGFVILTQPGPERVRDLEWLLLHRAPSSRGVWPIR